MVVGQLQRGLHLFERVVTALPAGLELLAGYVGFLPRCRQRPPAQFVELGAMKIDAGREHVRAAIDVVVMLDRFIEIFFRLIETLQDLCRRQIVFDFERSFFDRQAGLGILYIRLPQCGSVQFSGSDQGLRVFQVGVGVVESRQEKILYVLGVL